VVLDSFHKRSVIRKPSVMHDSYHRRFLFRTARCLIFFFLTKKKCIELHRNRDVQHSAFQFQTSSFEEEKHPHYILQDEIHGS
jgi:hypothetical protein